MPLPTLSPAPWPPATSLMWKNIGDCPSRSTLLFRCEGSVEQQPPRMCAADMAGAGNTSITFPEQPETADNTAHLNDRRGRVGDDVVQLWQP